MTLETKNGEHKVYDGHLFSEPPKEEITVRLDPSKFPQGEKYPLSLGVAEALLKFCGLTRVWVEPTYGRQIFFVQEMPNDIPQVGIHWIAVELLKPPTEMINPNSPVIPPTNIPENKGE